MAEAKRMLEKVDFPEIYEHITLSCKEGNFAILYSPNCILVEPAYYQQARLFFEQQKIHSLLSKKDRSYYNGLLRFDLANATNYELEALRNLDLTAPESKLLISNEDVFESLENKKRRKVYVEERCVLSKKLKEKINSLKSRKRHWKNLYSGKYKPKNNKKKK